jgi:hypothetical protein
MSASQMVTSAPNAVKLWETKTWLQAMRRSVVGYIYNRGVVYVPPELNGKNFVGDQISFDYVGKLTKVPTGESGTLSGNEEALTSRHTRWS